MARGTKGQRVEQAKRSRKSRNKPESAAETLEQIQSAGDRIAEWIGSNSKRVLIAAGVFLVTAASYGFWEASRSESGEAASIALAEAQHGLRRDMGTGENELLVAEPANPATAQDVRTRYLERFRDVADRFPGTPQGAIARLEVGNLEAALGDPAAALAAWEEVAGQAPGPALRGLALTRVAWAYEQDGRWPEAAAEYQAAGDLQGFPLRRFALADAARCYLEAGDTESASRVALQLESSSAAGIVPGHIRSQLAELRSLQNIGP
ncbi:MAG: tetratricopeptide repeat protein [Myxococcota bacterium]